MSTIAVLSLPGCLSSLASRTSTDEPSENTDGTGCNGEVQRLDRDFHFVNSRSDFKISISETPIELGDRVEIDVTNQSDSRAEAGTRFKFDIRSYDGSDWNSVYWKEPHTAWTAEAVHVESGESLSWEFTVDKSGIEAVGEGAPRYYVCDTIDPGRYMFVWWGVLDRESGEADKAIRTEFDVTS